MGNRIAGKLLGLEIDGVFVSCELSCALNFETELKGASAQDTGSWKEFITAAKSWSVTVDGAMLFVAAGASSGTILAAFIEGKRLRIRLAIKDASLSDFSIAGYAYVQNGGIAAPSTGRASWNAVLQGDGPLGSAEEPTGELQFGYRLTDPYGDEANLSPQFTKDYTEGATSIELNFTKASAANFLFAIVPTGFPFYNTWENNEFNFGAIPDFAWQAPRTLSGKDYYITRSKLYITSAVPTITLSRKSTTPTQFYFTDIADALRSTVYISNEITIGGITEPVPFSISGGQYSLNGGAYSTSSGYLSAGDTIRVKITSSASFATTVSCTFTVGTVFDAYDVQTSNDGSLFYTYNNAFFQRSNCGVGLVGSLVPYSKTYTSAVSQGAADALQMADAANYNNEGYANAASLGTCTVPTVYIWGKIFEENAETIDGITYTDVFLRTYKGTATAPPNGLTEPINATNSNIPIANQDNGGNPDNVFSATLANQQETRLVAFSSGTYPNPVFPKQITYITGAGAPIDVWFVFASKAENDWQLIQVVTP